MPNLCSCIEPSYTWKPAVADEAMFGLEGQARGLALSLVIMHHQYRDEVISSRSPWASSATTRRDKEDIAKPLAVALSHAVPGLV